MVKKQNKRVSASEKQYKELTRKVEAKIKRVQKTYGIDLTKELKIPDFSNLSTKERTKQKELMRSFTNRANTKYQFVKNENGVVISKNEMNEINRQTQLTQIARAKKIKERAKNTNSPESKMTLKQIINKFKGTNALGIGMPANFNFNSVYSKSFVDKRLEHLKQTATDEWLNSRDKTLQDNYIEALEKAFNSDSNDLVKKIKTLTPDQFAGLYEINDLDFELFYPKQYVVRDDALAELSNIENDVNSFIEVLKRRGKYQG